MEMMVNENSFQINGPLASYVVTGNSGKPAKLLSCSKCASGIYLECEADPGSIFLKVGSLDDASWVTLEMHIYTAAKQPWVKINDYLPQYEKAPEE